MTIVLPHGVLFRGGEEEKIRAQLIEKNQIDAIIGLPANIFFGTGIPTIIMVLKQKRDLSDVLIIDASKGFAKSGKTNKLQASDIKKIVDTYEGRITVPKYSRTVSREEIRTNDYNLNIPRYVDSSEEPESFDIYASMMGGIPNSEIDKLSDYWMAFPGLRDLLFVSDGSPYSSLRTDDVKGAIESSIDIQTFVSKFKDGFADMPLYLKGRLIDNMESVSVVKEETEIGQNVFRRLESIPLIDKYQAYQILDDNWSEVSVDFDIISTEGKDSIKVVDPNMVAKKDSEVQDGWKGRILPFELVQKLLLTDELENIQSKEARLTEIDSEYSDLLESLSEEDKELDLSLIHI